MTSTMSYQKDSRGLEEEGDDTYQRLRQLLHAHASNARDDEGVLQSIIRRLSEHVQEEEKSSGERKSGKAGKRRIAAPSSATSRIFEGQDGRRASYEEEDNDRIHYHNQEEIVIDEEKGGISVHSCRRRGSPSDRSPRRRRNVPGTQVEMRPGPTPYELWLERNEAWVERGGKASPKLDQEELDRLLEHLYTSDSMRQRVLARQQHEELAEELRSLKFQPDLNPHSLELASRNRPLSERQEQLIKSREEFLLREREKKAQEELKDCSFQPSIPSLDKSQFYLQRAGMANRSHAYMEYVKYEQQRRKKRIELKKHLEDREAKELTFKPNLTLSSSKLIEKLEREGRFVHDDRSRQILTQSRRMSATMTCRDPGHEQETFSPTISMRSSRVAAKKVRGTNVYQRLYANATKKTTEAHDNLIKASKEKVNLDKGRVRTFEETDHMTGTKAAWVMEAHTIKLNQKKEMESTDLLVTATGDPDGGAVNVVRYNASRHDAILQHIDPFFVKHQH